MILDLIAGMTPPSEAPPVSLTIVGSSKVTAATNITIPSVSGLAVGDLLIAFLSIRTPGTNVTFTPPSGWTALLQDAQTGSNPSVFAKVATAGDVGSTFAFSANNGGSAGGIVVAVRGASATLAAIGLSAIFSASGTQSTPYDCPSNSVLANGASNLILRFYSCNSALVMSLPSGTTQVNFSGVSASTTFNQVVSEVASAGTIPSKVSTFSNTSVSAPGGLSIAIPSA